MQTELPTIAAIRRRNLVRLLNEKYEGKQAALSRAIDRKPDYMWRVLKEQKGFGENLARDIEKILVLPNLWMDDPDNATESGAIPSPDSRIISVPPCDDSGDVVPGEGSPLRIGALLGTGVDFSQLRTVVMKDQSMSASIPQDDEVIINLGDKKLVDGMLYWLKLGNATRIRRLFNDAKDHWIVRCDTSDKMRYPDTAVAEQDLVILGRVVWSAGRR